MLSAVAEGNDKPSVDVLEVPVDPLNQEALGYQDPKLKTEPAYLSWVSKK